MPHRDDESSAAHDAHRDRTPPAGSVTLDERLRAIEQMLRALVESIGDAVKGHDTIDVRVKLLERVVYGGVGTILVAVLIAGMTYILRNPNAATSPDHTIHQESSP